MWLVFGLGRTLAMSIGEGGNGKNVRLVWMEDGC